MSDKSDKSDLSDKMVLVRREMLFGRAKALERAKAPWSGEQRGLVSVWGADYGVIAPHSRSQTPPNNLPAVRPRRMYREVMSKGNQGAARELDLRPRPQSQRRLPERLPTRRRRTSLTQKRLIQMAQRGCLADCSGCGWRCSRMRSGSLPVRVRLCTLL